MNTRTLRRLRALGACPEAVEWAATQPDAETAWRTCPRGDWLLWWVGRVAGGAPESVARKRLVLAACACARLALRFVPPGEDRPRLAIETAERWARCEGATLDDVRVAAGAARVAEAAAGAAAGAARAAEAAAGAAAGAARAAALAAAWAAWAAGDAARAAGDASRKRMLARCADAVRQHYPTSPRPERRRR